MLIKNTLLATVAAIALIGTANAGVIDISGETSDGALNLLAPHIEGPGALTSIDFDLDFTTNEGTASWGSEARITLEHVPTGNIFTAGGGDDGTVDLIFGWGNFGGNFTTNSSLAAILPDASGQWNITLDESFDDDGSPDGTYNIGSLITLVTTQVPEPTTMVLSLFGLGALYATRRRKKAVANQS